MRVAVGGATPAISASSPTDSCGASRSPSSSRYCASDMPASPSKPIARARSRRVVRNSDSQAALNACWVSTVAVTVDQCSAAIVSGLSSHLLAQAELRDRPLAHLVLLHLAGDRHRELVGEL